MKIYLAPMEGLADVYLRKLISQAGGYDLVVTEFVRVVDLCLPKRIFTQHVPELLNDGRTLDGTPVRVQLLGNHPEALALNAQRALELGSHGIDLNFGCPSKTVNSSKGGAVLLKEPETLYRVVDSVRKNTPRHQIVSAKMRLGFEDTSLMMECAHALRDGGADEIVVHARTKVQGYKPPAYWHLVKDFQSALGIPVIINGEIWNFEDAQNALRESNCRSLMIGRGAIQDPYLAQHIKQMKGAPTSWNEILPLVHAFWHEIAENMPSRYCSGRLKQWLNHLKDQFTEASDLFKDVRKITEIEPITKVLNKRMDNL